MSYMSCRRHNFGESESYRVKRGRVWTCYCCCQQPLLDLCEMKGWKASVGTEPHRKKSRKRVVHDDISFGREQFDIKCVNDVDDDIPPDFTYITQPVPGNITSLKRNPNFMSCCSCTDNCRDSSKCECAQMMGGPAYNKDGLLVSDKPAGLYECGYLCSCNKHRCCNRVVGNGIRYPLEVFRCGGDGEGKGWGVRCTKDIPAGAFITEYLGEVLDETDCEKRGLRFGDEYLFGLDAWGRSRACERLEILGLKREQQQRHNVLLETLLRDHLGEGGLERSVKGDVSSKEHTPSLPLTKLTSLQRVSRLEAAHFAPAYPGVCEVASMTRAELTQLLGKDLIDRICKSRAIKPAGKNLILCGGYVEPEEASSATASDPPPPPMNNPKKRARIAPESEQKPQEDHGVVDSQSYPLHAYLPSSSLYRPRWMSAWNDAKSIITDRVQVETESRHNAFTIDAK